jgi:hypothetical protein
MDYFDISQLSENNPWWKDEKSINQEKTLSVTQKIIDILTS